MKKESLGVERTMDPQMQRRKNLAKVTDPIPTGLYKDSTSNIFQFKCTKKQEMKIGTTTIVRPRKLCSQLTMLYRTKDISGTIDSFYDYCLIQFGHSTFSSTRSCSTLHSIMFLSYVYVYSSS